jgi:hypothetical protein
MVELVMADLSRGVQIEELVQLNSDLLPLRSPAVQPGFAVSSSEDAPVDGLGLCAAPAPLRAADAVQCAPAVPIQPSDWLGSGSQDFGPGGWCEQASVVHHTSFAADAGRGGAVADCFGPSDGFQSSGDCGFGADDGFGRANMERAAAFAPGCNAPSAPVSSAADVLAAFRGKSLKVKRSSGVIEGGWQLAAGVQVDAHGMVELVMADLSRGVQIEELVQLNSDLLPLRSPAVQPGFAVSSSEDAPVDGLGLCAAPAPPHVADSSSCLHDPLFLFRGKSLKVKRSSGLIDDGWILVDAAQLDLHFCVEVVKGELLRSVSLEELQSLNHDIVRVARGELTPEEILRGLAMGVDVFR